MTNFARLVRAALIAMAHAISTALGRLDDFVTTKDESTGMSLWNAICLLVPFSVGVLFVLSLLLGFISCLSR